jgi:hypothetical protein
MVSALVVIGAGCGDEDESSDARPAVSQGRSNGDDAAFCVAWRNALASGEEAAMEDVLADVPARLADAATTLREGDAVGAVGREIDAAGAEIMTWVELHCPQGAPGDSQRRVAPPLEAKFDGLTFCGTMPSIPLPADDRAGMVLYGDASAPDPYDGPMIGIVWNPARSGGHGGDGERVPVRVRGRRGVAAPITVFQQTVVPDLGTVIAWNEPGRAVGLYARGWSMDEADELVAIAERLEWFDGSYRIPASARPKGHDEIFAGSPSVASLVVAPSPLYSLRYQGADGLLDVSGIQMTQDEFEAFRFFSVGVDQGRVAGRAVLIGNAWDDDGPAVVTWRERDGLVVRLVGIGVALHRVREIAGETRELNADEWAALAQAADSCDRPGTNRASPQPELSTVPSVLPPPQD